MAFFRRMFNTEPAMMISALLATGAVCIPLIVVPYRRARGLPTYQWDGTAANPYLHDFAEEQERHTFDDPRLLAAWSKHAAYRWRDPLPPRAADDPTRDFPEARARIERPAQ